MQAARTQLVAGSQALSLSQRCVSFFNPPNVCRQRAGAAEKSQTTDKFKKKRFQ